MKNVKSLSVMETRKKNKIYLVKLFGGKCEICGYNKCLSGLTFHHLDPSKKKFTISQSASKSLKELIKESKKCRLLCRNCHAEDHASLTSFNFMDIDVSSFNIKTRVKQTKLCIVCNKKHSNSKFCSIKCSKKFIKISRPTKEMIRLMKIHKNFSSVGKILKCSANTIKKRMIKECPDKVAEYLCTTKLGYGKCLNCRKKIKIERKNHKFCSRICYNINKQKPYTKNIQKILELLELGFSSKQISKKLNINLKTLEDYIRKYKM